MSKHLSIGRDRGDKEKCPKSIRDLHKGMCPKPRTSIRRK